MSDKRDPQRFQNWLSRELEARDWSQAKLARELDVFKGTVGRWLADPTSHMHRTPNFESCRRLADLFGVDIKFVLDLVGIEGFDRSDELSRLQKDTIALVSLIPDELLVGVYHQLRSLIDANVQALVRQQLHAAAAEEERNPVAVKR